MLNDLNSEQLAAVTHTDGPLLIIAGAGTGKTKVLTERIIHLITEKNVKPSEILAITFTEKAMTEVVERVDRALPLGYEEICIKTFHGLADQILRENGLNIGLPSDYTILENSDQYILLKKNLWRLALDYYRPLGHPAKFISALLQYFSRLRDEDISPEKHLEYAENALKKAEQTLEPEEIEEAKRSLELAKAYLTYQTIKLTENYLDFGDLTYFALRLMEQRPRILREYQDRFRYILVDEFQDTNFAQNKFLMELARKYKNIMVVGDDDQGIYRFRGATVNNILQFEEIFPEAKKIILKENYRSPQVILDAAYELIQNNNPNRLEARQGVNKKLQAQKLSEFKDSVTVQGFSSYQEEIVYITNTIKKLLEQGHHSFGDLAILVRTNALAEMFLDHFERAKIPYSFLSRKSLFFKEEIKNILALLKFLANPGDTIALFRLLTMPLWPIPMEQIVEALAKSRRLSTSLWSVVKQESAGQTLFGNDWNKAQKVLNDLLEFSKNNSVTEVIGKFLYDYGYLKLWQNETNPDVSAMQNIAALAEKIGVWQKSHRETQVVACLEYLELLEEAEEAPKSFQTELETDKVKILTIHSAKGLEFPVVFLPSLVQNRFPSINRKDLISIPESLIPESIPSGDTHLEEERRLFYVALTRAKKQLYLTWSERYEGPKKWKKSIFLEEMGASKVKSQKSKACPEYSREVKSQNIQSIIPTSITKEPEIKLPIMTTLANLSYSKLETFKLCPLQYKYRYIFNLPEPPSHASSFGSSIHNTLKEFYQTIKNGGADKVSLNTLHELYEKNWIPYGYESRAHANTRKKKGRELLEEFYRKNSQPAWIVPIYLERNFVLKLGELRLKGRIDRLDKLPDGSYEVIDYKTGQSHKNIEIKKDLQLSIYALVCQEVFKIPVSKLSLYFLEDNEKISTERSRENLDQVKEEIATLTQTIKTSDFSPTPGWHCGFCNYRLLCPAYK